MASTAASVWENCLLFIKDNINPQAYKTWFEPIKPVKLTETALSIQVPSRFFYEWLEEHYIKLLKTALTRELGEGAKLIYA
ncbi:DnaA N-terminal domain-containing protein, partial [Nonlabens ulvanivorans]